MQLPPCIFVALLCSLAPLKADLVIVQKVEGAGQAGEQTIKIKGDKARTDLTQPVSMVSAPRLSVPRRKVRRSML